ncbi:MAG: hypothetical protein U0401_02550 [Anaerolineae bacterium]
MALEATFQELPLKLRELQTTLKYLEVFIGDKPHRHKFAEDLGEEVVDLWSRIDQAIEAANEALAAVQHPPDLGRARQALTLCQEQVNVVSRKFSTKVRSDHQMTELTRLGSRLQGEWPGWVKSIKQSLNQCQPPLHDVNETLARCWQELAEHAGLTSISVQATNIGQQIMRPRDRTEL